MTQKLAVIFIILTSAAAVSAGPYTESGIAGFVGDDWRPAASSDPDAVVSPIFKDWATGHVNYLPSDSGDEFFWDFPGEPNEPDRAIGPATAQYDGTVSLGELGGDEILLGKSPGRITLTFAEPISSGSGYEIAVFENGFLSVNTTPGGSIAGRMFCELAYVEVSSNGADFARFPSVSLTTGPPSAYGTIEISNIYNLAGKHPNVYSNCFGTPFDFDDLADHPLVLSGAVNLNNIHYVRIVDVPGHGDWNDNAVKFIDPATGPNWAPYTANHPIFDAWPTYGTGGFDLDAVGVLNPQQFSADINLDGRVDLADLVAFQYAWLSHFGGVNWIGRCDLAHPKDHIIDVLDLAVLCDQWLQTETWREGPPK
jgi:hypothetical protein